MKIIIKNLKRQSNVAVFFLLLVLLFTGCGKQMNAAQLMIEGLYSCTIAFTVGGQEFKINLTRPTAISYRFEVIDPPALSGMVITCDERGVTAQMLGLVFNDHLTALPGKSFAVAIRSALEVASVSGSKPGVKNGRLVFSGQCGAGPYEITAATDGMLLSISLPEIGIKATVSDFKVQ